MQNPPVFGGCPKRSGSFEAIGSMESRTPHLFFGLGLTAWAACSPAGPLAPIPCQDPLDCRDARVCFEGRCRRPDEITCPPVRVHPAAVDFGGGPRRLRRQAIQLDGLASCPLGLELELDPPEGAFGCSDCDTVISADSQQVFLWFRPQEAGLYLGTLTAHLGSQVHRIPLRGELDRSPAPWLEPPEMDLGHLLPGQAVERRVDLYGITPPEGQWAVTAPIFRGPTAVQVQATPEGIATVHGRPAHAAHPATWHLRFEASPTQKPARIEGTLQWMDGGDVVAEMPVRARTGPVPRLHWKSPSEGHRIALGQEVELQVPVANLGAAPLEVGWDPRVPVVGPFSRPPNTLRVPPGQSALWRHRFRPDEVGRHPVLLHLRSNDPQSAHFQVRQDVEVRRTPRGPVRVEAAAPAASGHPWSEDLRAYALELRFPDGTEVGPWSPGLPGDAVWTGRGEPPREQTVWVPFDRLQDGPVEVWLRSLSDCSAVPGPWIRGLLALATPQLLRSWWGELQSGVPAELSDAIGQTCTQRRPLSVGVTIRWGSTELEGGGAELRREGDRLRLGQLVVQNEQLMFRSEAP